MHICIEMNNNLTRCGDQGASTSVNSTARGEERSTVSVCCDSPEFQESEAVEVMLLFNSITSSLLLFLGLRFSVNMYNLKRNIQY